MRADGVTDVERPWVELVEDRGIIAARDELVARGVGASKAAAMAVWLADQAERRRVVHANIGSGYRAELGRVGSPTVDIPGYRNRIVSLARRAA